MARTWILDFVGASDEELARLRLLMRKGAPQLVEPWRLRAEPEERPDLVLVDASSIVGFNALSEARNAGVPCVLAGVGLTGAADERVLPQPFRLDTIVEMLNRHTAPARVESGIVAAPVIEHNIFDDFFSGESESEPDQIVDEHTLDLKLAPYNLEFAIDEAEAKLKFDEKDDVHERLGRIKLGDDVSIETSRETRRTAALRETGIRVSSAPPVDPSILHLVPIDDGVERYRLETFLNTPILAGPARLVTPDAVPLTLDPRTRLFFAKGSLCVFEPHCIRPLAPTDFQLLSIHEFEDVRNRFAAREYAELLWLCAYLNSGGVLAPHLDVNAMYRLRRPFEVGRDYPAAARIVRELQRVGRAQDLAAAARCSLGEVYNVLNAFDAIGLLDRA
jgi:hypothetical protein